ncbi:MAG: efflux RND transporter periplasmic adaptor subunit [Planctomycetales bacterium]|nr:efflux RND transporter periplasmic adaptor subunit [Planctomycetales bacterium]
MLTRWQIQLISLFVLFGPLLTFGGTIEGFSEPYSQVDLAVIEPGLLDSVSVSEGDHVKPNQVLATLNAEVLQKALAIAEKRSEATGAILAAEAEVRLRKGRLDQITLLRKRGHATEQEYARSLADYDIANARLLLAREEKTLSQLEVERIQSQINRRIVRSPLEGVVSTVHKQVGESFSVGDALVMTVVQLNQLKAKFSLTPEQAETLNVGKEMKIIFPGQSVNTRGKVDHISPIIDAKSGTVEVSVVIDNSKSSYRSGARCLLELDDSGISTTREVAHPSTRNPPRQ